MTCQTCHGTRRFTITVRNLKGPGNCQYQDGVTPWREQSYTCPDCTTTPCYLCTGTGTSPLKDRFGQHDGFDFCQCSAGRAELAADMQREIAAVDAEAHDQHRAAAAWHAAEDAREAALPAPDLHAQPF